MSDQNTPFNSVFGNLPTTIFEEMSRLAAEHNSVNLGQGFPDKELEGPSSMKRAVFTSMTDQSNQYPPLMGVPELRKAVAEHSIRHSSIPVDWKTETLITLGATEALASAFLGLLNPGDKALLFSPLYDSYAPMISRAGATPIILPLQPPTWSLPLDQIRNAFQTHAIKLIVINTPHNPTGKVFTRDELESIADLLRQYNTTYAVLDEVYQHLVYPGTVHTSLRSLHGMHERCIRIGSAGKTFSFTDFKIGWVTGPVKMISAITKAHQFLVFTVNSAIQRAVAAGLEREEEFYLGLGGMLYEKRQLLAERLTSIGFDVLPAQGTYFVVADFKQLEPLLSSETSYIDDVSFCIQMTKEIGVTLIPVSAFYEDKMTAPKTLVRFVSCKNDEKLLEACHRLERYFEGLRRAM